MNQATKAILESASISVPLTEHILEASQGGRYNPPPLQIQGLPPVNGRDIIDFTSHSSAVFTAPIDAVIERISQLGVSITQSSKMLEFCGISTSGLGAAPLILGHGQLKKLGTFFLPLVSFGLLNGGSASSYFDQKKNREFSPLFHGVFQDLIASYAQRWAKLPKGISPAFLVPGRTRQYDFTYMELKLRAWLLLLKEFQQAAQQLEFSLPWSGLERIMPVFQMVNRSLAPEIDKAMEQYKVSPLLSGLIKETGIDITACATGVQDLVAAFTLPKGDGSRDIFTEAWGKPDTPLAMPGGHGQNFKVLEPIYRALRKAGKKFAYLGNIDNLGYLPDPASIALMVLTGQEAAFEFSYKTSMDRKGGVLVSDSTGRLTCGDIGQAVSPALISETEKAGKPILFNCATGLFNLDYLVPHLEMIQNKLPIRFSTQDKDAGRYSQAEQTTWEIIGLIDKPLILAVSKHERFLAAKFFLDCLLTSGFGQDLTTDNEADGELQAMGKLLNEGLQNLLVNNYGLDKDSEGNWQIR